MAFNLINDRLLIVSEIESGLHYSVYEDLWIHLFESANFLDARVIATTHSLEIIEAFAKKAEEFAVATEQYKQNGDYSSHYLEIAKKAKTGEIIAIKEDADVVLYAIAHKDDIRGVQRCSNKAVK